MTALSLSGQYMYQRVLPTWPSIVRVSRGLMKLEIVFCGDEISRLQPIRWAVFYLESALITAPEIGTPITIEPGTVAAAFGGKAIKRA